MADEKITLGGIALSLGSKGKQTVLTALSMGALYSPLVDAVARKMMTAENVAATDDATMALWRGRAKEAVLGLRDFLKGS